MLNQISDTVLMVRPKNFGFNSETASTNYFQKDGEGADIATQAVFEFDNVVKLLRSVGIEVLVADENDDVITPDAVFPNNWFACPGNHILILFPMMAENRRLEMREAIIDQLKLKLKHPEIIDLTGYESQNKFLEGTGSIVFDHLNKIAFACRSQRTHELPLTELCSKLNYRPVVFNAFDAGRQPVYHTNVVMSVGENFAVLCQESIMDETGRNAVLNQLNASGREVINITFNQMQHFAGNMLQLKNKKGQRFIVCSSTAYNSLFEWQKERLMQNGNLLVAEIPVIEKAGGGSIRCMLAEIFN